LAQFLPEDQIASLVDQDIRWAKENREQFKTDWLRFYKLYKNFVDKDKYAYDSNVAIPTAFSIIEVQVAFLLDMVFEGGNFVEVLGKTPQGQASARAVRDLLDYHFRYSINTYEEEEAFIRQLLIYGTSIFKMFWDFKPGYMTRMVPKYSDEGLLTGYTPRLQPEILANKPGGSTVDIFCFGVDPAAKDIASARYAFDEQWVDPSVLMNLQDVGIYKNVDKAIGAATNVNEGLHDRLHQVNLTPYQNSPEEERGKVYVVDYWGYLTKGWENKKLKRKPKTQLYHVVCAYANSQYSGVGDGDPIVLFAEPSPFHHNRLPYIDSRINAPLGEFYGAGDLEFCESLLQEQRDIRNATLDNLTRTVNRVFLAKRSANIDDAELEWRPGQVIHVDNDGDVGVLDPGMIDPSVLRSQDDIRRDIESVTGVNDFVMGNFRSSTGFNDTATGISLIQGVAMKRIGKKGQTVQRAIRDKAKMLFALIAQYQPYETTIRVLDNESAIQYRFVDISPDALKHEYDFQIVNSPSLGSKPARITQMIQLFQIVANMREVDPTLQLDMGRFLKRIVDEMDVPNSDEFFGFSQLNKELPESLGEYGTSQEMLPPHEENRLMVENGQLVTPHMQDNHPQHMYQHHSMYESLPKEHAARALIEKHYDAHKQMAEQSKQLLGSALQMQTFMDSAGSLVGGQSGVGEQSSMLSGNTQSSPTGAGGQEDMMRGMANFGAGNA